MDCKKLKTDIDKLKSLHDSLRIQLDEMNETVQGDKAEIKRVQKQAGELEDQLLAEYLDDFAEKNPELSKWELSERVEGFEYKDGKAAGVSSISALPDGGVLVGGDYGALYELRKDVDNKWKLGERIEGFEDKDGVATDVTSVFVLPDGGVLVGGDHLIKYGYPKSGALYELRKPPLTIESLKENLDKIINKGDM